MPWLKIDPVSLFIAGSSGIGKTELCRAFNILNLAYQAADVEVLRYPKIDAAHDTFSNALELMLLANQYNTFPYLNGKITV